MEERTLYEGGERTFAVVCGTGDEAMEELRAFAERKGLSASRLTAIGAFSSATLGFFDWRTKAYREIPVARQAEVLALIGSITLEEGKPKVHAHVVMGLEDGTTLGGHLLRGVVRPTLEVVIEESPAPLRRRHDAESGLALIAPRLGVGAR